jgi:predicted DNA-binding protein (MmcQ/YjbR family)
MSTSRLKSLKKAQADIRSHALGYPESSEAFPWDHLVIKVKGKIFVSTYLDETSGVLNMSFKLPVSSTMALTLPFAEPTRYGLAKSGWVTVKFGAQDDVPVDMLLEWMDESFRAIAPKRVVAQLEEPTAGASKKRPTAKRKASSKRK